MALDWVSLMYDVYVLQNVSNHDEFYTGYSSDLKQRVRSHNEGQNASTRGRHWRLVYYEAYLTPQAARDRERILKHDGRVKRFLMDCIKKHLA